nr:MIP/aquaporin family protein [Demequina litorisediminis]
MLAEGAGTFILVLMGVGAALFSSVMGWGLLAVAFGFALGVIIAALIFGGVSGAHLNPAVTIGAWLGGRFPGRDVAPYIVSQVIGAVLASGLFAFLVSTNEPVRPGSVPPRSSSARPRTATASTPHPVRLVGRGHRRDHHRGPAGVRGPRCDVRAQQGCGVLGPLRDRPHGRLPGDGRHPLHQRRPEPRSRHRYRCVVGLVGDRAGCGCSGSRRSSVRRSRASCSVPSGRRRTSSPSSASRRPSRSSRTNPRLHRRRPPAMWLGAFRV